MVSESGTARVNRGFLATASFIIAGLVTRLIALTKVGLHISGIHVHHFVFGIALLLVVNILWLLALDKNRSVRYIMAVLIGVAGAMIFDEFAMFVRLDESVYWTSAGYSSLVAMIVILIMFTITLVMGEGAE